jgi:hypothetical protein
MNKSQDDETIEVKALLAKSNCKQASGTSASTGRIPYDDVFSRTNMPIDAVSKRAMISLLPLSTFRTIGVNAFLLRWVSPVLARGRSFQPRPIFPLIGVDRKSPTRPPDRRR